jgi:hypothetical protein
MTNAQIRMTNEFSMTNDQGIDEESMILVQGI